MWYYIFLEDVKARYLGTVGDVPQRSTVYIVVMYYRKLYLRSLPALLYILGTNFYEIVVLPLPAYV